MNKPKARVVIDYTHALALHGRIEKVVKNPKTSEEVLGFTLYFVKRTGEILALK